MKKEMNIYRSFSYFLKGTVGLLFVLFIPLLFIGGGVATIVMYDDYLGYPLILLGIPLFIFFGGLLLFFVKMLFTFRPVLVINEQGIFDHTTFFNFGMISWDEIAKLHANPDPKNQELSIQVVHPERISERYSGIRRSLLNIRIKSDSDLISIPLKNLSLSNKKEMVELILHYYQK